MTDIQDQEGSATPSYIDNTTSGEKLKELFETWFMPPKEMIGHQNRGGMTLDYLGHANTTRALIESDPFWSWEPVAWEENGLPMFGRDKNGEPISFCIWLTVHGKTLMGFGTVEVRKNEKEKELIGDAIRNAAMRFGVALGLWVKEDEGKYLTTEAAGSSTSKRSTPQTKKTTGGSAASKPSEPVAEEGVAEVLLKIGTRAKELGLTKPKTLELANKSVGRKMKSAAEILTHADAELVLQALDQMEITQTKEKS